MYGMYGMYGGMGGYGMDPTYFLVLIGAILSIAASAHVRSTYARYANRASRSGMTGAMVAEAILRSSGIRDVRVERISGQLTDHFDPRNDVVRLSDSTYNSTSVAAIGVAAHECGHVIQHKQGYMPIQLRSALVPVANIGSRLGLPLIIIGVILGLSPVFTQIGVLLFSFSVLFHLVTLPVEINASTRALKIIEGQQILDPGETKLAGKVLFAAALTYVASATASILQLLRVLLISKGGRRRR